MRSKLIAIISIVLTAFISYKCCSSKGSGEKLFTLKDAYYQSWIHNENERGTNIFIILTNVRTGITFDSIVFRGIKVPAFTQEKDGTLVIKSLLNSELSKMNFENKPANEPDKLIFRYNGNPQLLIIKDFRRLKMKYF